MIYSYDEYYSFTRQKSIFIITQEYLSLLNVRNAVIFSVVMMATTKASLNSFNSTAQAKEKAGKTGRQADNNSDPERNNQQIVKIVALASVVKTNESANNPNNSAQVREE